MAGRRNPAEQNAYAAGVRDRRECRVFRHAAQPGSQNRCHVEDYDAGWFENNYPDDLLGAFAHLRDALKELRQAIKLAIIESVNKWKWWY